ncbi:hypothetical protein GsuE55_29180 [Geobacillus subterraneus]|uniref:Uncharacterized protein n=1 Tax=Geobacillus subterraneus TaxID=129338 RepID=A0A679FTU4_9BACL|nr:hypothetical protein GsuE55_29180 [Geobacillus subterraneus]
MIENRTVFWSARVYFFRQGEIDVFVAMKKLCKIEVTPLPSPDGGFCAQQYEGGPVDGEKDVLLDNADLLPKRSLAYRACVYDGGGGRDGAL